MGVSRMPLKNNPLFAAIPAGPADAALSCFLTENKKQFSDVGSIAVAYSGGADSTALLLAAARHWPDKVIALHVHHGLQDAADAFWQHCQQQCEAWHIPLFEQHVDARHLPGESPEDAARVHRYRALADMAHQQHADCVLLAQHADDQVETLILALSRGAGLPGLACMPAVFERHGVCFARPLLSVGGEALRNWLSEQNIIWTEDPTNQDRRYIRNRIRLDVLPAIAKAFPEYRQTFARSATHAAHAQALLGELAEQDLQMTGNPPDIKALQNLSTARQANALRYWLKQFHHTAASTRQLEELLRQIGACQTRGHSIDLKIGHGVVVRNNAVLQYRPQ